MLKLKAFTGYSLKIPHSNKSVLQHPIASSRHLIPSNDQEMIDFGFKTVSKDEKKRKVKKLFDTVSTKYDLMNDIMSLGMHRMWKTKFVEMMHIKNNFKILDMAGGTGDVALEISRQHPAKKIDITIADCSSKMLTCCKEKLRNSNAYSSIIQCIETDAENPHQFENSFFDVYSIAFGIRNCASISSVLKESVRVLKPGGQFFCLEFANSIEPYLQRFYDYYLLKIIPIFGHVFVKNWDAYQYLGESIHKFPDQAKFRDMIRDAGFVEINDLKLLNGVARIHTARKP